MTTLRLRLLVAIGASFAIFWTLSSIWTLIDLRSEFRRTLDERLAASAHMVAALIVDSPQLAAEPGRVNGSTAIPLLRSDSVACEIRSLRGRIVGRTDNSPDRLGLVNPGYRTRTIDGVSWRSYTIEHNGMRITTADKVAGRQQLFQEIAVAAFVPFLIAMVASLVALWYAVRHALRPLERIRVALEQRDPSALQPLAVQGLPDEVVPLAATVNGLLARIERTIERERRFTGDAAHELRTPLTAVKTHIQVARLSDGGPEKAVALEHAEQAVQRLQRVIDQLLMLVRVEGSVSFEGDELLSAADVANQAVAQLPQGLAARVRLRDDGGAQLILQMPASLAATALRNILDNALRYGEANAVVSLAIHQQGDMAGFTVKNRGACMTDAEIRKAGERFWRKGGGQGSGLGLSIVKAIVARYGGCWELGRRDGGGMSAHLALPAVPIAPGGAQ